MTIPTTKCIKQLSLSTHRIARAPYRNCAADVKKKFGDVPVVLPNGKGQRSEPSLRQATR